MLKLQSKRVAEYRGRFSRSGGEATREGRAPPYSVLVNPWHQRIAPMHSRLK